MKIEDNLKRDLEMQALKCLEPILCEDDAKNKGE